MTPDVVVDIGNSRMKWGRVRGGAVVEMVSLRHDDPVGWKRQLELWGNCTRWAAVSVSPPNMQRFSAWLLTRRAGLLVVDNRGLLSAEPVTGFRTRVKNKNRVGTDRLLNALAAVKRTAGSASAVAISVGTAMTVDFVEPDGTHVGGAILPGPRLMARSLHEHTAALPLLEPGPNHPYRTWGANTDDAIAIGIASAVRGAADQLVWDWADRCGTPPWVYITGGDAKIFRGYVLTADTGGYVIDPTLTLDGIRIAAEALP